MDSETAKWLTKSERAFSLAMPLFFSRGVEVAASQLGLPPNHQGLSIGIGNHQGATSEHAAFGARVFLPAFVNAASQRWDLLGFESHGIEFAYQIREMKDAVLGCEVALRSNASITEWVLSSHLLAGVLDAVAKDAAETYVVVDGMATCSADITSLISALWSARPELAPPEALVVADTPSQSFGLGGLVS